MGNKPLAILESHLESLIEGAFARIFHKQISVRDLSILIMRAMEEKARAKQDVDGQPVAPDSYYITLHPETRKRFLCECPDLAQRLARLVVGLTQKSGFLLNCEPQVFIEVDKDLAIHQFNVSAHHSEVARSETKNMYAVGESHSTSSERRSILIVGESDEIKLDKPILNIGRDDDNDIVIDDAYVSRHHLQLRYRNGAHILVDVESRGGTHVNNIAVQEQRLHDGDVIRIGHTELVYKQHGTRDDKDGTTRTMAAE